MIELPELRRFTGPYEDGENYICSAERSKKLTEAQANEILRRCEDYEGLEKALVKLLNMGNAGEGCRTCHLHPTNLCDCKTEKKEVILQALEVLTEAQDA